MQVIWLFLALASCASAQLSQQLTYLKQRSVEIDSAEEGGAPGRKQTSCPCGWANKVAQRIVNGTETNENEFPFAAGIVWRRTNFRFCGATIITVWHALTAAHCTEDKHALSLGLLVGEHDITDKITGSTEVIPLARIVNHEKYNKKLIVDDIALLVTSRQIKFSSLVGPACLPTRQNQLANRYIKIVGWGAGYFKGPQSNTLQKVNVRVVPMNECGIVYRNINTTIPKQICTYRNKRASCQGDSGGPVIWNDPEINRYTHVGIVSYGRICGDFSPSVHTDVGAYLKWIKHWIQETKPATTCSSL